VKSVRIAIVSFFCVAALTGCSGAGKKSSDNNDSGKGSDKKSDTKTTSKGGTMPSGEVVWTKTCSVSGDSRTITVSKEGNGCIVSYSKFDSTSNPARSQRGTQYCEEVASRIQNNLSNAGFDCK